MNYTQKLFNIFFKILWFINFLLLVFLDRNNFYMVTITILLLLIVASITVVRSLNSRNEWRKMIKDGDVEIKDKISF